MKAASAIYQQWQAQRKASRKKPKGMAGKGISKDVPAGNEPVSDAWQGVTIKTGLPGAGALIAKCEAGLKRLEQELQDPAKSEEESQTQGQA